MCIWNHFSRLGNYIYTHELNHVLANIIKPMFLGHLWNSKKNKNSFIASFSSTSSLFCCNKWIIVANYYHLQCCSLPKLICIGLKILLVLFVMTKNYNVFQMNKGFFDVPFVNFHLCLFRSLCQTWERWTYLSHSQLCK